MSEASADLSAPAAESVPPEVAAMSAALDRGDHRRARELAETLRASDDPALKKAGEEMAARFRTDPWVNAVFVGTGLLMVFLAVHYLGHR